MLKKTSESNAVTTRTGNASIRPLARGVFLDAPSVKHPVLLLTEQISIEIENNRKLARSLQEALAAHGTKAQAKRSAYMAGRSVADRYRRIREAETATSVDADRNAIVSQIAEVNQKLHGLKGKYGKLKSLHQSHIDALFCRTAKAILDPDTLERIQSEVRSLGPLLTVSIEELDRLINDCEETLEGDRKNDHGPGKCPMCGRQAGAYGRRWFKDELGRSWHMSCARARLVGKTSMVGQSVRDRNT